MAVEISQRKGCYYTGQLAEHFLVTERLKDREVKIDGEKRSLAIWKDPSRIKLQKLLSKPFGEKIWVEK